MTRRASYTEGDVASVYEAASPRSTRTFRMSRDTTVDPVQMVEDMVQQITKAVRDGAPPQLVAPRVQECAACVAADPEPHLHGAVLFQAGEALY